MTFVFVLIRISTGNTFLNLQIMKTFNSMIPVYTTCLRDGSLSRDTQVRDLVKGDIVYVEVGDVIPADIRIIDSKGFKVRTQTTFD